MRRLKGAPPSCVEVYELLLPPPTTPLPVVVLVLWCKVDESPLWYVAVPFSTSPLLCRGGSAVVAIFGTERLSDQLRERRGEGKGGARVEG